MNEINRRELSFASQDDIVADVERLAAGTVRTSGKHSFGAIIMHLALANDMTTGKVASPKPPLLFRLILPLIRSRILNGPVKPGFKLPSKAEAFFWPKEDVDVHAAIQALKESAEYYKKNGPLPVHPMFGAASRAQVDRLTLKHAEMHLSFVHPA